MIGIVLAGGRASRMGGGEKGRLRVGGISILGRVIATMRSQCDLVLLNAADPSLAAEHGCSLVPDDVADRPGPLAGVLAGLDHAALHHPDQPFVVTVPTDTPFLPGDLVARLQDARVADRAQTVCARSGGSAHPVVALWSVALRNDLRRALVVNGTRRMRDVLDHHAVAYVDWPSAPVDPFFNVNTPADLAQAEVSAAVLAKHGSGNQ